MATIRFDANPAFRDDLGNDPTFRRFLLSQGISVRQGIQGNLPSGAAGGRRVAAYARKSFAEIDGVGREVEVHVGTTWRLGHLIEFGSRTNPAYAPLRKSVIQRGMKFEEGV